MAHGVVKPLCAEPSPGCQLLGAAPGGCGTPAGLGSPQPRRAPPRPWGPFPTALGRGQPGAGPLSAELTRCPGGGDGARLGRDPGRPERPPCSWGERGLRQEEEERGCPGRRGPRAPLERGPRRALGPGARPNKFNEINPQLKKKKNTRRMKRDGAARAGAAALRSVPAAAGSAPPPLPGPARPGLPVPLRTRPAFGVLGPSPGSAERCGAAAAGAVSVSLKPSLRLPRAAAGKGLPCRAPARAGPAFLRPAAPSRSPASGVEIPATDVQTQFLVRTAPSHKNCVWTIRSGDSCPGLAGSSRGNSAGAWKIRTHGHRAGSGPGPAGPLLRP